MLTAGATYTSSWLTIILSFIEITLQPSILDQLIPKSSIHFYALFQSTHFQQKDLSSKSFHRLIGTILADLPLFDIFQPLKTQPILYSSLHFQSIYFQQEDPACKAFHWIINAIPADSLIFDTFLPFKTHAICTYLSIHFQAIYFMKEDSSCKTLLKVIQCIFFVNNNLTQELNSEYLPLLATDSWYMFVSKKLEYVRDKKSFWFNAYGRQEGPIAKYTTCFSPSTTHISIAPF